MGASVRRFVLLLSVLLGIVAGANGLSVRAADDKPAETKAAETKAAETKPAETPAAKPEEKKPEEKKAEEKKPEEKKPEAKVPDAKKADEPKKPDEPKKADETKKPDETKKADEPAIDPEAPAKFEKKMNDWKNLLKQMRDLQNKAQGAPPTETAELQKQWNGLVEQGNKLLPELREVGRAAYLAVPNVDRQLLRFLIKMIDGDLARDDYESAMELAQLLIDHGCDDKAIYNSAGIAAFGTNQFDKAEDYFKLADEAKTLAGDGLKHRGDVARCKELWAKEVELRKAEAEKNDLPRVQLLTSKGPIVIELFENEAPEAVANFISLVESHFYDGKTFHRVLGGFMAQGGCPKGDGTGGPGYNIYCECQKENARMHFRGSLSMAHAGRDTGGSQFFLTFLPTTGLNGRHTVFGRIVEGMDVLARLQRIDPGAMVKPTPDAIVKAEVLRKRDHKYEPNKVK